MFLMAVLRVHHYGASQTPCKIFHYCDGSGPEVELPSKDEPRLYGFYSLPM